MSNSLDEAIMSNSFEKWEQLGAKIIDTNNCLYQFGFSTHYFNKIFLKQQEIHTERQIEQIIRPFKQHGINHSWLVSEQLQTPFLHDWLIKNGFIIRTSLTAMIADLCDCQLPEKQSAIEVKEFLLTDLDVHVQIIQNAFSFAAEACFEYSQLIMNHYQKPQCALSLFIGYFQQKPVACGTLLKGKTFAGIYNIGTIPSSRQHGVATQLMRTLLERAKKLGYTQAVLGSMPAAESLYQKIGFKSLSKYAIYIPNSH